MEALSVGSSQLHAWPGTSFTERRRRINARELWEQMNTCSCLNLILACIAYWQGREMSRALSQCDPAANGIDLSLLEHAAPSSGITLCSMASIFSTESSPASAVAQKESVLVKNPANRRHSSSIVSVQAHWHKIDLGVLILPIS